MMILVGLVLFAVACSSDETLVKEEQAVYPELQAQMRALQQQLTDLEYELHQLSNKTSYYEYKGTTITFY